MKEPAFNPYLPSWEYIPDGEPYVFDGRVYVYGSHDCYNGHAYCQNDYVCWSAPEDDLSDWRYEGVIYPRNADPANSDGDMLLFAPDVCRGADGRYYLYYVLDSVGFVSVAVCDTPAGRYQFYGYVQDKNGHRLGDRPGDEAQFDPGVLMEDGKVYLYTGFCMPDNAQRHGAMVTVLEDDMLTIAREPQFIVPSKPYEKGTGYEGHAFFEASSMRRANGQYYFIYSSVLSHELCYATSDSPLGAFTYGGTIVSNCDMFIDSYKPADRPMYYGGNNHGSIIEIAGQWYIFYHRQTNGCNYARQGCIEPITILPDGRIPQVEMTSCGANGAPLPGEGTYPAHIACHLFCPTPAVTVGGPGDFMDDRFPRIMQDQPDGVEGHTYIGNMTPGSTAGFRRFDLQGVCRLRLTTRGCAGAFEVRTAWDGDCLGSIPIGRSNEWKTWTGDVRLPDGVHDLHLTWRATGRTSLLNMTLCKEDNPHAESCTESCD